MVNVLTFYLSRIIRSRVHLPDGTPFGVITELFADTSQYRPKVIAAEIARSGGEGRVIIDYSKISLSVRKNREYRFELEIEPEKAEIDRGSLAASESVLSLMKQVLDKRIVDMEGKKVVRVNDLRFAVLSGGTYLVAADVGFEGLLRRLGISGHLNRIFKPVGKSLSSKMILWGDVETVDYPSHPESKLPGRYRKLSALHPSDLADIIEELDVNTQSAVFESLDTSTAADVLEELETGAAKNVLQSMTVEKAAGVLEEMPSDEAADILEEFEEEKVEELLQEMKSETSFEIRELMEYADDAVGSFMTKDFISFNENMTLSGVISELRRLQPDSDTIYYIYVVDDDEKLVAVVSLRDIIVADPDAKLSEIMKRGAISAYDDQDISILAGIIDKYNLLALPVVNRQEKLVGMVIVNDIVCSLLKSHKRNFKA